MKEVKISDVFGNVLVVLDLKDYELCRLTESHNILVFHEESFNVASLD